MQAYELFSRVGADALTLVDRPSPRPGPCDVRIRVRAVSLNYRDLLLLRAAASGKAEKPVIPASDGAGEIIETGDAVSRHKVGDRVIGCFFPTWQDGPLSDAHHERSLGGKVDGTLAQEIVLHEDAVVAHPTHLSFEEGATLPCAGLTAWNALFEAGNTRVGDVVLLQGTGGVSLFSMQLAKAAGARVIMTSSSAQKRDRLRLMGVESLVDYVAVPGWGSEVRALSGGQGVDLAVEVGGPGTFDQTVAALRYGGTMSLLGVLTGFSGQISTQAIFRKTIRVMGIYVGSRRMFESFNRALERSAIHPVIDSVYEFHQVPQAYERLASGAHFGKIVVRVA